MSRKSYEADNLTSWLAKVTSSSPHSPSNGHGILGVWGKAEVSALPSPERLAFAEALAQAGYAQV